MAHRVFWLDSTLKICSAAGSLSHALVDVQDLSILKVLWDRGFCLYELNQLNQMRQKMRTAVLEDLCRYAIDAWRLFGGHLVNCSLYLCCSWHIVQMRCNWPLWNLQQDCVVKLGLLIQKSSEVLSPSIKNLNTVLSQTYGCDSASQIQLVLSFLSEHLT